MLFTKRQHIIEPFIKNNNKIICHIMANDFINKLHIIKPIEQRLLDIDKVQEIVDVQDKYYKSGKYSFNFLGTINIHCCKETNKNYLLDGQHRYNAIRKLVNEFNYKDFKVAVEVVLVETYDELKTNYALINKNTELPEFPDNIDKNIPEEVASYFFDLYPEIFKTTSRKPKKPYIHKNDFQEAIGFLISKIKEKLNIIIDAKDVITIIANKNKNMQDWTVESYNKSIRKMKHWDKYKKISDNNKFYLGMYTTTKEDYVFQWIIDIIQEYTGHKIKKNIRRSKKKKIPNQKRSQVWEYWLGPYKKGICFCCRENKLDNMTSWECGHIISSKDGGLENVNNLRPVCSSCNKSMSSQNMRLFINKHYPDNLKLLDIPYAEHAAEYAAKNTAKTTNKIKTKKIKKSILSSLFA